jgi:hypothetical protein
MHPLAPDLSGLSDNDLQKRMSDLMKRLVFCSQMGQTDSVMQLQMLYEDIQMEVGRRNQLEMEKLQAMSNNFNSVIDIK